MRKILSIGLGVSILCCLLFCQETFQLDESRAFNLGRLMEKNNALFIHPIDIDRQGDSLFLLDLRMCHVLKADLKTGALLKVISSRGQGPSELMEPTCLRIMNKILYVCDRAYGGIKMFGSDDGRLLRTIKTGANMSDIDVRQNGNILLANIDPQSSSLVSEYDAAGNKIRDLVRMRRTAKTMAREEYFYETYIRFRLDPEGNLIVLFPFKRSVSKYDKEGALLWERSVENPVLKARARQRDTVSFGDGTITFDCHVFNVAIDEKGNIVIGHSGGGLVFSPLGNTLAYLDGHSLLAFLVEGNEIISVVPQGGAYIFKIHL